MTGPRTVRLTDRRLGEASPSDNAPRTVAGFQIEQGIPAPQRRNLKLILAALAVGESIVHTASGTWTRRLFKDRKFTQKKLAHKRYRIWRTE